MQGSFVISNPLGLHVRPAKKIVECAGRFPCRIQVECEGKLGSAKSLIGVLSIEAKHGDTVTLIAEGEQEAEAFAAVGELLTADLDG